MEVKLKVFLNMGEEHIEHLKLIWSTDDKKRRSSLKREYLSAGSISGTFYTRDKNVPLKEKLKHYNGIIALDFDDVQDVEACKQKIAQLPYVYYVGLSASKRGFYAIIPLDNADYTKHFLYFVALRKEMEKLGFTVDKACSDVPGCVSFRMIRRRTTTRIASCTASRKISTLNRCEQNTMSIQSLLKTQGCFV